MEIKLGHFLTDEDEEKNKIYKNLRPKIKYEDKDICESLKHFVEFASVFYYFYSQK